MKKRKLLTLVIAIVTFAVTNIHSQTLPSYVPTNGLVGYWGFNGNANDQSGNGNNGTVNGATLTTDRNGNANSAYSFNGVDNRIDIQNSFFDNGWSNYTINYWLNVNQLNSIGGNTILNTVPHGGFALGYSYYGSNSFYQFKTSSISGSGWDIFSHDYSNTNNINSNTFYQFTIVKQVTDPNQWANLTTGAWCYYNNDPANGEVYGKLYNWYAVNDPRGLAPVGWHVPSDNEFTSLADFFGGLIVAGGKLKEAGTLHFLSPNTDATNSTGFTGLPGGYCDYYGPFRSLGEVGFCWTASGLDNASRAWSRDLYFGIGNLGRSNNNKTFGFSVRLIKD